MPHLTVHLNPSIIPVQQWAVNISKQNQDLSNYLAVSIQINRLFSVNKNHPASGSWLCFFPSLPFAPQPGLQTAVLACLAECSSRTSLLLEAMNLKRQHHVGTTLGCTHTLLEIKPFFLIFQRLVQGLWEWQQQNTLLHSLNSIIEVPHADAKEPITKQ